MEEKITKNPLRIAFIAAVSTFIGFSIIFPLIMITNTPGEWWGAFLFFFYFLISGLGFVGLIIAFLVGLITYLTIRFFIKKEFSKRQSKWMLTCLCIAAFFIGFFTFFPVKKFVMELSFGKEHVGTVDNNGDGKPDKWVHHGVYDNLLEIDYDTNLDGKPDIWEYYKNSKVYKKEIDTDFDGKPDKVENYK